MTKPTTTPYGYFSKRCDAYDYIAKHHIVEFVLAFPGYAAKYPYSKSMNYLGNNTNNAARHYVANVMKRELIGKVQGWQ